MKKTPLLIALASFTLLSCQKDDVKEDGSENSEEFMNLHLPSC